MGILEDKARPAAALRSPSLCSATTISKTNPLFPLMEATAIHAAAELTLDSLADERTCGALPGGLRFAEPLGVVAGVLTATDPCASVRDAEQLQYSPCCACDRVRPLDLLWQKAAFGGVCSARQPHSSSAPAAPPPRRRWSRSRSWRSRPETPSSSRPTRARRAPRPSPPGSCGKPRRRPGRRRASSSGLHAPPPRPPGRSCATRAWPSSSRAVRFLFPLSRPPPRTTPPAPRLAATSFLRYRSHRL